MKNNVNLVFIEIKNLQNVIFFNTYNNYKYIYFCLSNTLVLNVF